MLLGIFFPFLLYKKSSYSRKKVNTHANITSVGLLLLVFVNDTEGILPQQGRMRPGNMDKYKILK
jgi:hypothetical protein